MIEIDQLSHLPKTPLSPTCQLCSRVPIHKASCPHCQSTYCKHHLGRLMIKKATCVNRKCSRVVNDPFLKVRRPFGIEARGTASSTISENFMEGSDLSSDSQEDDIKNTTSTEPERISSKQLILFLKQKSKHCTFLSKKQNLSVIASVYEEEKEEEVKEILESDLSVEPTHAALYKSQYVPQQEFPKTIEPVKEVLQEINEAEEIEDSIENIPEEEARETDTGQEQPSVTLLEKPSEAPITEISEETKQEPHQITDKDVKVSPKIEESKKISSKSDELEKAAPKKLKLFSALLFYKYKIMFLKIPFIALISVIVLHKRKSISSYNSPVSTSSPIKRHQSDMGSSTVDSTISASIYNSRSQASVSPFHISNQTEEINRKMMESAEVRLYKEDMVEESQGKQKMMAPEEENWVSPIQNSTMMLQFFSKYA